MNSRKREKTFSSAIGSFLVIIIVIMKKIVVLILALVMLASILVMPAMAAEAEARGPFMVCPKCGGAAKVTDLGNKYEIECLDCGEIFYRVKYSSASSLSLVK